MNKCTKQLHVDMSLYMGSEFINFRNHLHQLFLFQIYPDRQINDKIIELLDIYYIQPMYHIYCEYLKEYTKHDVQFHGDGTKTQIEYKDTGAVFQFEIYEYGDSDIDVYYFNSTDDEACRLIHLLEYIYPAIGRCFDIDQAYNEIKKRENDWLNEIYESAKQDEYYEDEDDYDDDEETELWQEYLSEIREGYDEWKARKKANLSADLSNTEDITAGTLMYYDGTEWQEIGGISNVEINRDDETTQFYADDGIVYVHNQPEFEFSFTCNQLTSAMEDFVDQLKSTLKKSHDSSQPP